MATPLEVSNPPLPFHPEWVLVEAYDFGALERKCGRLPSPLSMVVCVARSYGELEESFYEQVVHWYLAGYQAGHVLGR